MPAIERVRLLVDTHIGKSTWAKYCSNCSVCNAEVSLPIELEVELQEIHIYVEAIHACR